MGLVIIDDPETQLLVAEMTQRDVWRRAVCFDLQYNANAITIDEVARLTALNWAGAVFPLTVSRLPPGDEVEVENYERHGARLRSKPPPPAKPYAG